MPKLKKDTLAKLPTLTPQEPLEAPTPSRGNLEALRRARESRGPVKSRERREMPEGVSGAGRQIRKFCLDCVGGSPILVRHCLGTSCPLWAWRFGKSPAVVRDADLLDAGKVREMAKAREARSND